jgi:hypothetical protein
MVDTMPSNSTTIIQADLCRETLINDWVSANVDSTEVQTLLAIQETSLYAKIKSGCQSFIDEFNIQSGETRLLEQQTDGEMTYSEFWGIGPANMDGDWSLAVDTMFSSNFTEIGTSIPCANSCYTLHKCNGIPGCESLKDLGLPAFGSVAQQRVCDMQWGDLDYAYNVLRICAAKLVGKLCHMMHLHFELL